MANSRRKYNDKMNISGMRVKEYRKLRKLSREELSNKLMLIGIDVPGQAIANLENGTRTIVDYELCGIAEVLDISILDLLKDYEKQK